MKIAIISDSHNSLSKVCAAVEIFKQHDVSYILHAGDLASNEIAEKLTENGQKLIAVFGNCDMEKQSLEETITSRGGQISPIFDGKVDDLTVYMVHKPYIEEAIQSGKYDLVIYGHTHRQEIRREKNTLVINPGQVTNRFGWPSQIILFDTEKRSWETFSL